METRLMLGTRAVLLVCKFEKTKRCWKWKGRKGGHGGEITGPKGKRVVIWGLRKEGSGGEYQGCRSGLSPRALEKG